MPLEFIIYPIVNHIVTHIVSPSISAIGHFVTHTAASALQTAGSEIGKWIVDSLLPWVQTALATMYTALTTMCNSIASFMANTVAGPIIIGLSVLAGVMGIGAAVNSIEKSANSKDLNEKSAMYDEVKKKYLNEPKQAYEVDVVDATYALAAAKLKVLGIGEDNEEYKLVKAAFEKATRGYSATAISGALIRGTTLPENKDRNTMINVADSFIYEVNELGGKKDTPPFKGK